MNHQTLYTKYRPQDLSEVKGQESVVSLFENALKDSSLGHAYLFKGGRGTGKTSVARIVARRLGTAPVDIIELDAASNRGIDEIRSLKENISSLPFSSPYKVYIIDEAHMLTIQAANALLKTLEEPPAHVIFILATTDPDKLPATIISRCQVIDFKKPSLSVLSQCIRDIAEKEGISLDEESIAYVARLGNASFRDAESHLEKLFRSVSKKDITIQDTEKVFYFSSESREGDFIESFMHKDVEKLSSFIRVMEKKEVDMLSFVESLIYRVRFILLLRLTKDEEIHAEVKELYGNDEYERLLSFSRDTKNPLTSKDLVTLIDIYDTLKKSSFNPCIIVESALL
jgi:DNA polymerase III subunit gamma/tau